MDDGPYPDDLLRLAAEADGAARRLFQAQDPQARFEGSDPEGAVTVVVDGTGQVREVMLAQSWRHRPGPGGLPPAVRAAMEAAMLVRLDGVDRALDDDLDEAAVAVPLVVDGQARRLAESISAQADGDAAIGALREVLAMLETLDDNLDQLSAQIEAQTAATYIGHSADRHVSATVSAVGALVEVDIDPRWLTDASNDAIGRAIGKAVRDAQEMAGRHSVQGLVADSPVGRIGRLANDPVELARRLGLHTDR